MKTQALTLEQIRERGIVLGADAYIGFQFTLGVLMESKPVEISLPVIFDRQGVAMPPSIPLPPPILRTGELPPVVPAIVPVLLTQDVEGDDDGNASPRPELTFPDGVPVRIPSVLVIPGNVGYLKQHFSAQLFVANGAPLGTGLIARDVTGTVKLRGGGDNVPGTPDDPLVLAPLVSGTQPATMPVQGVGRSSNTSRRDAGSHFGNAGDRAAWQSTGRCAARTTDPTGRRNP